MESRKLQTGEKYLSVILLGSVKTAAFRVKQKKNPAEPDFKGDGIAIWVNEKKAPQEAQGVEREDVL